MCKQFTTSVFEGGILMVFQWLKRKKEAKVSRKIEVEEVEDFEAPEFQSAWKMGASDHKMVDSLVAEMQRTGAIQREPKKVVEKPSRYQSVQEIGQMLQETADGLDEDDNRDNDYYSDTAADAEMLERQSAVGENIFDNPIFDGGEEDDPYEQYVADDAPPLDDEDYYRYGPGGQTHGRLI